MFERYAIFYTPKAGAFAKFGAAWLGWDSARGEAVPHPEVVGLDIASLTRTPRKYGLHATLKAPFRLADGQSPDALRRAVDAFAENHASVCLGGLTMTADHGFVALRPDGDPGPLRALAAEVVTAFDPFRAPLNDADITRRRKARLTPRQDAQMLRWGYPYVFEDFNFHMTLTGGMKRDAAEVLLPQISAAFGPVIPGDAMVDAITLMGEDTACMFHQVHRAALSG